MPLPLALLPCSRCGGIVAQLRPPELPADIRGFLVPLVKIASLKVGERLELPASGNLFELVTPEQIARLLEVECAACALTPLALRS